MYKNTISVYSYYFPRMSFHLLASGALASIIMMIIIRLYGYVHLKGIDRQGNEREEKHNGCWISSKASFLYIPRAWGSLGFSGGGGSGVEDFDDGNSKKNLPFCLPAYKAVCLFWWRSTKHNFLFIPSGCWAPLWYTFLFPSDDDEHHEERRLAKDKRKARHDANKFVSIPDKKCIMWTYSCFADYYIAITHTHTILASSRKKEPFFSLFSFLLVFTYTCLCIIFTTLYPLFYTIPILLFTLHHAKYMHFLQFLLVVYIQHIYSLFPLCLTREMMRRGWYCISRVWAGKSMCFPFTSFHYEIPEHNNKVYAFILLFSCKHVSTNMAHYFHCLLE